MDQPNYTTKTRLTHVHARRMMKLYAFLMALKPALFDFSTVCELGTNAPSKALEVGGGCGTVACAMGWMPAVFPRMFKWIGFYNRETITQAAVEAGEVADDAASIQSRISGLRDFSAVEVFFGLSYEDARFLFMPASPSTWEDGFHLPGTATPKEVAARLKWFVDKFGPKT